MSRPMKTVERFMYSEIVYHDEDGTEVARERLYDDAWYDTAETEPMTEEEIEDYIGGAS